MKVRHIPGPAGGEAIQNLGENIELEKDKEKTAMPVELIIFQLREKKCSISLFIVIVVVTKESYWVGARLLLLQYLLFFHIR